MFEEREVVVTQPTVRRSGRVIPQKPAWHGRLLAVFIHCLIRTVSCTIRFKLTNGDDVLKTIEQQPAIFCIWHNRLALSIPLYRKYLLNKMPRRHLAALVSASRDGGLLARILELFGVQPVRGSSSRRGPQALLELTTWAERGYDLAITPDGPRGPCYHVQNGVIALAALTGNPIVPVTAHLKWKVCLHSWDRFQIPIPFTQCTMTLGKPVHIPRESTEAERETLRAQLEARMLALTRD